MDGGMVQMAPNGGMILVVVVAVAVIIMVGRCYQRRNDRYLRIR